jgi:Cft2 family RNA processing exonuclease
MLLAESDAGSLLYTGDFRLKPARTCAPAEVPQADILIMESTYGHPRYRFPDRREVEADFLATVRQALDRGVTPIIFVYSLGKAQEATKLLTEARVPVMVHEQIAQVNRLYEELGVPLGEYASWDPNMIGRHAVLVPPAARHGKTLHRLRQRLTIQLTGWAMDRGSTYRMDVDRCFPFSDHADFDELFEVVRRVNPRRVYCTHGPVAFVKELQYAGWDARALGASFHQPMLF